MTNTPKDRLTWAIEAFVLAREWIFKPYQAKHERDNAGSSPSGLSCRSTDQNLPDPWKAGELYLFLDELHSSSTHANSEAFSRATDNETKTALTEKLRKRYEPYLKEFSQKFNISVSFQDKFLDAGFEGSPMKILSIAREYIQDMVHSYSDEAMELVVRNWSPYADVLYFFVVTRYAILNKVPIEFEYEKLMHQKLTYRKVIPLMIVLLEHKLSLIAKDLKDGETKSFLISKIKNIKSDLRTTIHTESRDEIEDFDYTRYRREDPNATFHRTPIDYEIEIDPRNLDFLRHTETLTFQELARPAQQPNWKTIQVKTHRERDLFDLLFNYGLYARLVAPDLAVEKFRKELNELRDFYQNP